jgi:hypothetical protein
MFPSPLKRREKEMVANLESTASFVFSLRWTDNLQYTPFLSLSIFLIHTFLSLSTFLIHTLTYITYIIHTFSYIIYLYITYLL